ncbi:MAG: clan AA aspartic protease [Acidobacteria bacterium]|nr:clan AA aspartic protease [Acidobacteriota bacterium]MBI3426938.1 clan AA aspartic protease [Acidobacteriota bacterium]
MGLTYAEIELISSDDLALLRRGYLKEKEVRRAKVSALVDSGAYMLAVNDHLKAQLGLPVLDKQEAELADGSHVMLEIVGPVDVRFANRATTVRAMVLPGDTEVLLGSIPMEDMDVLVDPKRQQLIVNPENPYIAKKHLK